MRSITDQDQDEILLLYADDIAIASTKKGLKSCEIHSRKNNYKM